MIIELCIASLFEYYHPQPGEDVEFVHNGKPVKGLRLSDKGLIEIAPQQAKPTEEIQKGQSLFTELQRQTQKASSHEPGYHM